MIAKSRAQRGKTADKKAATSFIIDTDFFSDCDDAGALAIANFYHNTRRANLLGVVANTHSRYVSEGIHAMNDYYGNGHIPIASLKPLDNATYVGTRQPICYDYASKLAATGNANFNAASLPDPVSLYRRLLVNAPVRSIKIVSIGFLGNLRALLNSKADEISSLSGIDLVKQKVNRLYIMGGTYPSGREYNFRKHPDDAAAVVSQWPGKIKFLGFEVGLDILSGGNVSRNLPAENPLRKAYEAYHEGQNSTARPSWDPLTMILAIEGTCGYLKESAKGTNVVDPQTGSNIFTAHKAGKHSYVQLLDSRSNDAKVQATRKLEELFRYDPKR